MAAQKHVAICAQQPSRQQAWAEKHVGFSAWLTPFFRAAKTGGIVPPLISLERDVQPGVHVVREVPSWGRADPLWNFNWENLPHKAILWLYYGARISRAKPFPH
jgi:hypothetical protein